MQKDVFKVKRKKFSKTQKTSTMKYISVPDTCILIHVNNKNEVLMVRQYRNIFNDSFLEVPGGSKERHETPEKSAKREFLEETGYIANNITYILSAVLSVGTSNEKVHIFRSTNIEKDDVLTSEIGIELVWIDYQLALEFIKSGKIIDAKTIIALQNFYN